MNLTKKGCGAYYKMLKKKQQLSNTTRIRETKWHTELNCTFGTEFWGKTYTLAANIKYDNKLKWLQYQINRNSLFTNYKVHKFKPNVSPLCSFCGHQENFPRFELVSHLFYDCDYVINMWLNIKTWLASLNTILPLQRSILLFGIHSEQYNSVLNYIILCAKSFIWKAKFSTKDLSFTEFQKYLYAKLLNLKNALLLMGKEYQFQRWINIYESLTGLPGCIEAILPDREEELPPTAPVQQVEE